MSVHLVLLCACLEFYICLTVSSCLSRCQFIKLSSSTERWNEDRKSNQCSRCLRAYGFPFHFPHSGKTKNDTQVNEQTAEVVWGNATVHFWLQPVTYADHSRIQVFVERVSGVCACTVCVCVCVSELQREWPGECWILSVCDRERDNAANRCQAKLPPSRATVLFIASLLKKAKIFLSLPRHLYLSVLIVFFGVFYFLNVLIPHLEGELRLSPQLLWQPLFASEKVHLKGPTKCATTCLCIVLHLPSTANMGIWEIWGGSSEVREWKCLIGDIFLFLLTYLFNLYRLNKIKKNKNKQKTKKHKKKGSWCNNGIQNKDLLHFTTPASSPAFPMISHSLHHPTYRPSEELTIVLRDFMNLFVFIFYKCSWITPV